MSALPSTKSETPAPPSGIVLLPAGRFFVRRIPLVAGQDPVAQVELALETIGPFAPAQLYFGYCPSNDGTHALAFAAYRRNIPAAETSLWAKATAVLPEFSVWLGLSAPPPAGLWLHDNGQSLTAIAWDGKSDLPAGILSREASADTLAEDREELLREAGSRFELPAAVARSFTGPVTAAKLGKEGLGLQVTGGRTGSNNLLTPDRLAAMDVRDKAELAGQYTRQKRDRLLWLTFVSVVTGLAACIAIEGGLLLSRTLITGQRAALATRADTVRQIEQANQLTVRLEELAGQSLRPFDMLLVLNGARPASLDFIRASTGGPRQMELEVQSSNATDPQEYERALQASPAVEKVALRDFRTSAGRTTFIVSVTFSPGFAGKGGTK